MIRFLTPEWLIFLPFLLFLGWWRKELRLWEPLRALLVLLGLMVLMQPEWRREKGGMDLWVLVDRSASAATAVQESMKEWEGLLRRDAGLDDRIRFVDYSDSFLLRSEDPFETFTGNPNETATARAVTFVLSKLVEDRHSRILLLSDGYSTEPLGRLIEPLTRQGVPLDYRLVVTDVADDYRVSKFVIPPRVELGEPFLLDFEVRGMKDGEVPYEIARDGKAMQSGTLQVSGGKGQLRFTDRISQPGAFKYQVRVNEVNDTISGNNEGSSWIDVVTGPSVLLVTNYKNDPLGQVLRARGFVVREETEPMSLTVGALSGADGLILNNVPANKLPEEFIKAIPFYITGQGRGLLMAGGKGSFGAGGYFESPVDELLPVSMELKNEHRKLTLAMGIVMDRSGSMSMTVAGGKQKMDLANDGASRSVELLGSWDYVTVFAVDSEAHQVVPLTQVGPNRNDILKRTRRISSQGGGIYVYEGLKAGWDEVKKSKTGTRHLILFSDAADSEEPGDYKRLIDEMRRENCTVSVIGLGTPSDPDAKLLEDVAKRGGGRIFFNQDPTDLPAIFAQETVAVARSAFIEEPIGVKPTAGWEEIASGRLNWLREVDGFNLSYLRPGATSALNATDEYESPLLAFWRRGLGRVGAISFPMGGEFSSRVRNWAEYADFVQTLTRWAMGERVPPGVSLHTSLAGNELTMELRYHEDWAQRIAQEPPKLVMMRQGEEKMSELDWQRMKPGLFTATTSLNHGGWIRGAVQIGPHTIPFGPVLAGVNPEWSFDSKRIDELRAVSKKSGGRELVDLSSVWKLPRHRDYVDLRVFLLIAMAILLLIDAWLGRVGIFLLKRGFLRKSDTTA